MVSDATLRKVIREIIDVDDTPVASATDVADSLPIEREAVRQRLVKMAADGDIETRKVGRSRVFWIPGALTRDRPEPEERIITDDDVDVDDDREGTRPDHGGDPPDVDPGHGTDLRDLAEVDTPPSTPSRDAFEAAGVAIVDYLRDAEEATRSDVQEALHEEHPAGYASNARTWWRRVARPVLEAHAKVELGNKASGIWRYTG